MSSRDRALAYAKEYYAKVKQDPERLAVKKAQSKKSSYKYVREKPERKLLWNARYHAKERGVPFNLEVTDIVIPDKCPVFGVEMKVGTPYAPSVDRIIPALGYVKGNIQVISRRANLMKQDASPEELRKFANWINQSIH